MKKRVVSLLLCLIMALSLIPTAAFATEGADVEETTPVVEAQAEPAAETPVATDEAVVLAPPQGGGPGHNPGTNNNGKPQALGWKYAKITSRNNGGYTCSEASVPSGATITVTVGKGTAAQTLIIGQSCDVWNGVTNTTDTPVTVSVSEGYYISAIVFCCNDRSGYSCQTSQTDLAFKRGGSLTDSSVTMTLGELWKTTPHQQGNNTSPYNSCYWLMIMVKECPDPVYVGYDVGTIEGVDFGNIAPVDKNTIDDGGSWLNNYYTKSYPRTGKTDPQHTVLGISEAAEQKANENGYTFDGWLAYRYDEYEDENNTFSGGNIDPIAAAANDKINLNAHTKLVAQWKEVEKPTTGNLIITKNVEGVTLGADKTFMFNVTKGTEIVKSVSVTVPDGQSRGSFTISSLPLGTYTVTEVAENAGLGGFNVAIPEPQDVTVTAAATGASVTFTNKYTKLGSLTVEKVVAGDLPTTMIPKSFTFTVTDSSGNKVEYEGSENITVPANGKLTIPNLPVGEYTVTEQSAKINGYDLSTTYKTGAATAEPTKEKAQVEVTATGATVTVTNTYTKDTTSVTVSKEWNDDLVANLRPKSVTVQLMKGTTAYGDLVVLNATNQWSYTWTGLSMYNGTGSKITYSVKEVNVPAGYVSETVDVSSDNEPNSFSIINTANVAEEPVIKRASLTVIKKDADNGALLKGAKFTLIPEDGNATSSPIEETNENGEAVFDRLLPGTYTLKEVTAPAGYQATDKTWTITVSDDAEIAAYKLVDGVFVKTITCTVDDVENVVSNGTITITNAKDTASLVITKTLNEALPKDMTFEFNVMKGTNPAIIGAKITIEAGKTSGTAIVKNLTVGKTYTVQEVEKSAQLDGYTVVIPEAQKVTISGVATKDTVTFENKYTKNTGTLTISKVLKGDLVATDFDKPFTFTIWKGTNEKRTVEVWPGNPVTLTLNPGTYTIVEDKAAVEGYDLTTSFAPDYRVEVKAGENTAVVATNTYTKTVTPAPEEHTFTIDITKNIELLKRTSRNPGKASFTFQAYMVDEQKNVTVLGEVTIETRGTKSASGKLTFTLTDEQLTYGATVYVREVEGNARGWTYDDTIYELKIGRGGEILTGDTDLTFTNDYYRKASNNTPTDDKTVKSVKTGDMGIAMYAMTSLLSLGGAALVIKKRKDEK